MKKSLLIVLMFVIFLNGCLGKSNTVENPDQEDQDESITLDDLSATVKIPDSTKSWKDLNIKDHEITLKYPKFYDLQTLETSNTDLWHKLVLENDENAFIDIQVRQYDFETMIKDREAMMVVNQKKQITIDKTTGVSLEGVQPGQFYILFPLKNGFTLLVSNISMKTEEYFRQILQTFKLPEIL